MASSITLAAQATPAGVRSNFGLGLHAHADGVARTSLVRDLAFAGSISAASD
jgi:hypothetical protein